MEILITNNFKQTQKAGEQFAQKIISGQMKKNSSGAVVLALHGDLGVGKTTFLQGLAKGLGILEVVNSPTFVIMKKFEIPTKKLFATDHPILTQKYFYHFDCYRLEKPEEILELGFKEIISNPSCIVAIEWPEKIESLLPGDAFNLFFEHTSEHTRTLKFKD